MQVINVMSDGSTRKSVAGIVIKDKRFYEILNEIQRKVKK